MNRKKMSTVSEEGSLKGGRRGEVITDHTYFFKYANEGDCDVIYYKKKIEERPQAGNKAANQRADRSHLIQNLGYKTPERTPQRSEVDWTWTSKDL